MLKVGPQAFSALTLSVNWASYMYGKLVYRMVKLQKEAPSFVLITSHKDYGHRCLNGTAHSITCTDCKICVHPKVFSCSCIRNYLHPFESCRIFLCVESTTLSQSRDDLEFPTTTYIHLNPAGFFYV
jgi:hypothetical protein